MSSQLKVLLRHLLGFLDETMEQRHLASPDGEA